MKPIYHFAFLVPTHKIEETKIWISNKIKILEAGNKDNIVTFENWKAQSFYFYDIKNNLLECIAREDFSDEHFKPSTAPYVMNINEVEIATDLPLSLSKILIQKTKINYFAKGPVREDFAALGNEEELFVISKDDRNWFPTCNLAEKHFLKVKFEVLGKDYEETLN
ncbi:VOC family protein [Chryseobacterium sp.]|uniref:VOC family protein n=1 Tax=Chryseobacterium sp. TaxID=1871047 RepID=UPI003890DA8E